MENYPYVGFSIFSDGSACVQRPDATTGARRIVEYDSVVYNGSG